jgi:hypothetical protein
VCFNIRYEKPTARDDTNRAKGSNQGSVGLIGAAPRILSAGRLAIAKVSHATIGFAEARTAISPEMVEQLGDIVRVGGDRSPIAKRGAARPGSVGGNQPNARLYRFPMKNAGLEARRATAVAIQRWSTGRIAKLLPGEDPFVCELEAEDGRVDQWHPHAHSTPR